MSERSQELKDRAIALRALADDVEVLLDGANNYITGTMTTWAGPNQEEVSGAVTSWKTECGTVAGELRTLATSCDNEAQDIEDQENEDDE
jgi:uncharacterized protein YukE